MLKCLYLTVSVLALLFEFYHYAFFIVFTLFTCGNIENAAATRPPLKLTLPQTTQLVLPSNGNGELLSPKLSEPRHLFSLQLGPQQAPRWPAECQVN